MSIGYKITGKTVKGRCSCGHIAKKGEHYYITKGRRADLFSQCLKCGTPQGKTSIDINKVNTIK